MRSILAVVAGVAVAVMLWYLGLVAVVLVTIGIPLGAQPRSSTPGELAVMLVLAACAAAVGGRTAANVGRGSATAVVAMVAAILAAGALWGFSGRNAWADWWGPAVALAMGAGAFAGLARSKARRVP